MGGVIVVLLGLFVLVVPLVKSFLGIRLTIGDVLIPVAILVIVLTSIGSCSS